MPELVNQEFPERRKHLLSPTSKINLVVLCILFLIFCGLTLTEYLDNIVLMLAASLTLTYILLGPVEAMESGILKLKFGQFQAPQKLARALAILLVYLLLAGGMAVTVFRVIPPLATQIKEFARDLPTYLSQASGPTENATQTGRKNATEPLAELVQESWKETRRQGNQKSTQTVTITSKTSIMEPGKLAPAQEPARKTRILKATYMLALEKLAANYKQIASRLGSIILDWGTTALSGLIYILTTLVLVFYLLHDGRELKDGFVDLMPARNEEAVDKFLTRLHLQFHSIIKGQLVMGILSGGLIYVLLLLMGIKYALLLGVFFGVVSILPVIGPWIGLIPIIAILAFSSHPIDILQVLLLTGVFYLVKTYWLWPKLIHRKYDVHPILFIVTFVGSLKLAGMMGLLLSFPLATVLGVFLHTIKASHLSKASTDT